MAPAADADCDGGHLRRRRRRRSLALVSLFVDVCACGSALLLLRNVAAAAWVRDASHGSSLLSPRFSASGFCNSESADAQTLSYTFNNIYVTISLSVHVPRLLLVGASSPDHVAMRVGDERFFLARSVTGGGVVGLSSVGGHHLLDVALACSSLVDILSTPPRTRMEGGYLRWGDLSE